MTQSQVLTRADAPTLGREREREAAGDALAVKLDEAVGFTANTGPSVAATLAGILDDNLDGIVGNDQALEQVRSNWSHGPESGLL